MRPLKVSQLEDYTQEGQVAVDNAIKATAAKYAVPESTLRNTILWEVRRAAPETVVPATPEETQTLITEYTKGKADATVAQIKKNKPSHEYPQ